MSTPLLTNSTLGETLGALGSPRTKDPVMDRRTTEDEVAASTHDNGAERPIFIGARKEVRVEKLPLTLAQDFLATERQRARIANAALDELLAANGNRLDWNCFDRLRDELKCRTGVNDAAVSLVLFMRLRSLNVPTW